MGANFSVEGQDPFQTNLYGSGTPSQPQAVRPKGSREVTTDTEYVPLSQVNTMVTMFQHALSTKDNVVEELGESLEQVRTELQLAKGGNYDEEQLLQELQRLLKVNAELMQSRASLESDNKMLQQEGDLLAQQLESVTFYMKNTAAELESERKNRVVNEQRYKEARDALRILYRDVQILTKSMNAQRQIVSMGTMSPRKAEKSPLSGTGNPPTVPRPSLPSVSPCKLGESHVNKVLRKDYVLPGNLAAELEAEFQQHMLQQQIGGPPDLSKDGENVRPAASWNATFEY